MKILIVDDSKAMRMLVKRALRQAGVDGDTVEAENGAEALEVCRAEAPSLILSDWNMPEMDGLTFLRELRKSGDTTRFGFVTSNATADMRHEAVEAGASFFITKPFTPDSIEAALKG
jgi:two-component system chemotaxis response regulator CheY